MLKRFLWWLASFSLVKGLLKCVYRYTRPRSMRHMENIWPYFEITVGGGLKFMGKQVGQLLPWSEFSVVNYDQALVIATGSSVKLENLSDIHTRATVVGVNGAIELKDIKVFHAYVIIDRGFVANKIELVAEVFKRKIPCFMSFDCFFEVCKRRPELLERSPVFQLENIVEPYSRPRQDKSALEYQVMSNDLLHCSADNAFIGYSDAPPVFGVFDGATVVYSTIQALSYLGFKRIGVLGMDMGGERFYQEAQKEPSQLDKNYQSVILPSFTFAAEHLTNRDIELVNLSLKSRLPDNVVRKISLGDFLNDK